MVLDLKNPDSLASQGLNFVELEEFEPSSRESTKELSTCLAYSLVVGNNQGL